MNFEFDGIKYQVKSATIGVAAKRNAILAALKQSDELPDEVMMLNWFFANFASRVMVWRNDEWQEWRPVIDEDSVVRSVAEFDVLPEGLLDAFNEVSGRIDQRAPKALMPGVDPNF